MIKKVYICPYCGSELRMAKLDRSGLFGHCKNCWVYFPALLIKTFTFKEEAPHYGNSYDIGYILSENRELKLQVAVEIATTK